ncbi:MAG: endonuclease/exonuclease/phosphatase family protein [Nonlabens sp.]
MIVKRIFQVLGMIAALMSLIPLIAADYWWIRMFDFPHIQLTVLTVIAILLYFFTFDYKWKYDYLYISVLIGCLVFQMSKFIDYTPVWPVEIQSSTAGVSPINTFKIYTANVLQKNDKHEKLIEEIKELKPDLIVFTETNTKWMNWLQESIGSDYPHKINQPQDNTYGMLVYSKLPLENAQTMFLVDPEIPSMRARVKMKNGKYFQLLAIHPTPPTPQHNPMSTDRDTELMKTAIKSYQSDIPVIMLGDFNDVAWSRSTKLTKTIGKLLDLRIGRGFYNTYNAKYPLMRWPLDHILLSPEFRIKDAATGGAFGSDHFPSWAELTFEPELASEQIPEEPTKEDWKRARDQMDIQGLDSFESLPDTFKEVIE